AVVLTQQLDAGVGHDDVEALPALGRSVDRSRDLSLDRTVGRQYEGLAAGGFDRGGGDLQRFAAARDQANAGAFSGEADGGRLTDAGAGAGHDGALARETAGNDLHRLSPSVPRLGGAA